MAKSSGMRVKFVSPDYIRKLFNNADYAGRAARGEFTVVTKKSKHPAAPRAKMPVCTRSETLVYLDKRRRAVAIVHQYRLANDTIGASGKPDPKYLSHGGTIYQVLPNAAP
jgi:hypothetical protein